MSSGSTIGNDTHSHTTICSHLFKLNIYVNGIGITIEKHNSIANIRPHTVTITHAHIYLVFKRVCVLM